MFLFFLSFIFVQPPHRVQKKARQRTTIIAKLVVGHVLSTTPCQAVHASTMHPGTPARLNGLHEAISLQDAMLDRAEREGDINAGTPPVLVSGPHLSALQL